MDMQEQREAQVRRWFSMWLDKQDTGIEELFDPDAVYIESWGPEYHGSRKIKLWFDEWNTRGTVEHWDIREYFHKGDQTVVEWAFRCAMTDGTIQSFDGLSLIRWNEAGQICFLQEFGCNENRYDPYAQGDGESRHCGFEGSIGMATSRVTEYFPFPVERVWQVVTDLSRTAWRSDLAQVEILGEIHFVEHTKSGYATDFTVTACQPLCRWAFTMENGNMSGSWEGIFEVAEGGTRLHCTETVNAKHWWMRPFVPSYLKRQQKLYLDDLRRELLK